MNIKKAYYYLFYKFYKFGEASPSIFPSDFTAVVAIVFLQVLFLGSLKFYYIEFFDRNDTLTFASLQTLIPLAAVILINYFAFFNNENWKAYVHEFDELPKSKNLIGTWIVIGIVALSIGNVVLAVHIMGEITGIN